MVYSGMKTNNLPVSGVVRGMKMEEGRDNFRGFLMRLRLD